MVQVAGSIWAWPHHFTNTPHFKAYKRLIEGARASERVSSTRECRALSPSDIPEAATHGCSTTPGSGATPSRPPGIVDLSWWGSARAMPPAILSGLGTKAGSASSGWWVSPPWSYLTPVAVSWSEETHTAWLLASTMSARPLPAGSETGRRTEHILARGEQIHLLSPIAVPNHQNRLLVQPPLSLKNPLPRKHVRPAVQETGDVRCSDGEEVTICPQQEVRCLLAQSSGVYAALAIYIRDHRRVVGANQYMLLF